MCFHEKSVTTIGNSYFCPENNLVWVYMQKGHNGPHPRPRPKNLNLNVKFKILFLNFNLRPKT